MAPVGAFNPVMENGGGGEHHPWAFDEETVSIYRRFAWLHHAMVPYLMESSVSRWEMGTSLMEFVDDEDYAFFFGDDIFVWPISSEDWSITISAPDGLEGRWSVLSTQQRFSRRGQQSRGKFLWTPTRFLYERVLQW